MKKAHSTENLHIIAQQAAIVVARRKKTLLTEEERRLADILTEEGYLTTRPDNKYVGAFNSDSSAVFHKWKQADYPQPKEPDVSTY